MAMKVLAKCVGSKGRVGAAGLSSSYSGFQKAKGYATVNSVDTDNLWVRKPKGSPPNVPSWNKLVDAAREALDNSSIDEDEKEAVLEDLQRRVDNRPKNTQTRNEIRLHFTMAIQKDDVPAALKTFAVTTRLTDKGRTVDAIMKDVRVALDEHVEADKATKAALLVDLKRSLADARTSEQRRAVTGKIYKALRHPDALVALQAVASNSEAKFDEPVEGITEDAEQSRVSNPEPETFMDVAYVQAHMPLPTGADFPNKKIRNMFAPATLANAIEGCCGRRKLRQTVKANLKSRKIAPNAFPPGIDGVKFGYQIWTCDLQFAIAGLMEKETVVGHGLSAQSAKQSAFLQILSRLYAQGALPHLFAKPGATMPRSAKVAVSASAPPSAPALPVEEEPVLEEGPFPTKEDYPNAGPELWEPRTISSAIHNACQKQKVSLESEGEHSIKGRHTHYELKVNIPGILTQTATGRGPNVKLAKIDAWSNMVKRMHASGHLHQLFPGGSSIAKTTQSTSQPDILDEDIEVVTVDDLTMKAEKDAKMEIYNYAASYGLVPEFEIKPVQPRTRRFRVGLKKTLPVIQVSIKLGQLGIEVTSAGKNLSTAEVAAAISFKREAEKLLSSEGGQSPSSPVSGLETLNVDTAPTFFDFYRSTKRGVYLDLEHEFVNIAGVSHTSTSVTINGETIGSPVTMTKKKNSTAVAYLCAALEILKAEPELIPEFAEVMRQGKGKFLKQQRPVSAPIGMETLDMMRDTLVNARRRGLPDEREALGAEEDQADMRYSRRGFAVSQAEREAANDKLLAAHERFQQDPALQKLRDAKASLPMSQYRSQVINISQNLYSIIIGATGSGKTTQVPQILLEDAIERGEGGSCDIVCTQPRRLAATSVAQRVAAERNEPLQRSVGYHVRFDPKLPRPAGSITYCTTGILLEQLKHGADGIMDKVSHLVIDEVHERDLNIDFLLIILKKAIKARQEAGKRVPKVILMSATLDTKLFAEYLTRDGNHRTTPCPFLSVPGRTFPVKERYLQDVMDDIRKTHSREFDSLLQSEKPQASLDYLDAETRFVTGVRGASSDESSSIDWKRQGKTQAEEETQDSNEKEDGLIPTSLLAATIAHICNTSKDDGAILAFLPGLNEITRTEEILLRQPLFGVAFGDPAKFKIHALHSQIPPQQQNEVLERPAPGCRKIILSTNIAETSITVPDVKHVIDLGKLRESRYDQLRRITKLQTVWESNSNARQRAGRAGRVQEGNYYGLYSRERRSAMPAAGLPELLRSDLQTVCLSIKAQGFEQSVSSFLDEAIESPPQTAVTSAVENLKTISAFTRDEKLTSLGRVLSKLPVHPNLAKMILLGVVFRCLDPMLILGSMDGERSLFVQPISARTQAKAAHNRFNAHNSDHLALLEAFRTLRKFKAEAGMYRAMDYGRDNFLHIGAFKSIDSTARQIEEILKDSGIVSSDYNSGLEYGGPHLNTNSNNPMLIKCLFLAGVHPNIGVKNAGKTQVHRTGTEQGVLLHPGSLNFARGPAAEEERLYAFSTLAKSVSGDSLFMRDATVITPLMAMLFGGTLQTRNARSVEMDDWLPFRFDSARLEYTTKLVLEFRKALDRVLHSAFKALSSSDGRALAQDPVREYFASNLAEMLKTQDHNSPPAREPWVPAGWGRARDRS